MPIKKSWSAIMLKTFVSVYFQKYFLLLLLFTAINFSQEHTANETSSIHLTGFVFEEGETKQYLPNANIILIDMNKQSTIDFCTSDRYGKFEFKELKPGLYQLAISFLGHKKKIIDSIYVAKNKIYLGEIYLEKEDLLIKEVNVTAEKLPFQYDLGKLTVNVDKVKGSNTETVTELLYKVPFVSIMDNKILLNGSSNITILIDGKKSNLTSFELLQQMPVNDLDRIDVITNPPAKYSAEGSGGIIDITTKKKDFRNEFKSNLSLGAGTNDNNRAFTNLYYSMENLSLRMGYNGYFRKYDSENSYYRVSPEFDDAYINRSSNNTNNLDGHKFSFGTEYALDEQNDISASVSYSMGNRERKTIFNSLSISIEQAINSKYMLTDNNNSEGDVIEGATNYTHSFDSSKQKVNLDLFFSISANTNEIKKNYTSVFPDNIDFSDDDALYDNKNHFYSFSSDYSNELSEKSRFEAGFRSTFRRRKADYQLKIFNQQQAEWELDQAVSNDFRMDDMIMACYLIYKNVWFDLTYNIGLRGEYTNYKTNQIMGSIKNHTAYFDLFPSVYLSYSFGPKNTLNLSYNRRIDRPMLFYLNPFKRVYSKDFVHLGNPNIKPSYIDVLEVSKEISLFGNYFNVSLNYKHIIDIINNPNILGDDGIVYSTPMNNERLNQYGLNISTVINITDYWNIYTGGFYSYNLSKTLTENEKYESSEYNFYVLSLGSTFNLLYDVKLQISSILNSGYKSTDMKTNDSFNSRLSIKKDFFDRKLSVDFSISNLWNSRNVSYFYGSNFWSKSSSNPPDRIFMLSFSYNFNKYRNQRVRKPDEDTGAGEYKS